MAWLPNVTVAMVLALTVVGCAPPASQTRDSGAARSGGSASAAAPKRITVAIGGELTTLRSQTASTTPGIVEAEQLVNAGLAAVDNHGLLQARLAEEVPSIQNG